MGFFDGDDQRRAEQLYECARVVGQAFLEGAVERDIITEHAPGLAWTIHAPDSALRLGYVLVAGAYSAREGARPRVLKLLSSWMREVFARQRLAAHRRLWSSMTKAMGDRLPGGMPYMPPSDSERASMGKVVDEDVEGTSKESAAIADAVRRNRPSAAAVAYERLQPAFGGRGDAAELEERYGELLSRLLAEARTAVEAI